MALKRHVIMILVFSLFTFSSSDPDNGVIAVYWGQNNGDGDLTSTCDSGLYKIVNLAFLNVFGAGRTPAWNFAGHCDNGAWKSCTELEPEIKHCQAKGIKVILSIGGAPDYSDYSLSSAEDAKSVANYLYTKFLSGQYGPLGSVTLDGIDFDIEKTEDYWDDLAKELDAYREGTKKFYLSAAPQCPIPVYYLGKAIETGLFDYIFIQFYNNPSCSGSVQKVLESWNQWVDLVESNNTLFLGLPAAPSAAGNGYLSPLEVNTGVLPVIKKDDVYGGVVLWDRYHDILNNYSSQIHPYVFKSPVTSVTDSIYEIVYAAMRRVLVLPGSNKMW